MKDNFLNRFGKFIKGTLTGFDRIIFKGILKPIVHENGFQSFLYNNNILNKNFKEVMIDQSKTISILANEYTQKQIGCNTIYLNSSNIRKEELVHKKQNELGIKTGLIGTWSCLESCSSFKGTYNKKLGHTKITKYRTRCKHIYHYIANKDYGFMSVRLQTWAPYNIV
jgi:hypothetical protein